MKLRPASLLYRGALFVFVLLTVTPQHRMFAQSDTIETNVPALKDVYARDFTIGCLLSYRNIGFPTDPPVPGQSPVITPNGGYLIKFHMNSMSPGNNMKPMYTVDINGSAAAYTGAGTPEARDSIDIHPIVRFNGDIIAQLNWAQRQGFTFRGHTLVWHSQTPAPLFRSGYVTGGARLTKEKMTARMENYIKEVIRLLHEGWPGLLSAMDVVNEAVTDAGGDRTDSEWYLTFGDNSYIMKAFELTRKYTVQYGETQMKLYYNDYNTSTAAKATKIAQVCSPIFRAGFLDGIGMQEHDANNSPSAEAWIASYNKFDTVCTEMAVTELDVTTGSANPSAAVLTTQANQYGQLFKCFVERSYFSGRGKIINVSKDGLNDQYTFKTSQSSSLWTAQNKCKPSFFAVVGVGMNYNALDSLITYSDTLQENRYTPDSWVSFAAVLASAKNTRDRNYSNLVSADTALGLAKESLSFAINGLIVTGIEEQNSPQTFALSQNYPNPFNPTTVVRSQLPVASEVKLVVYDLLGREVAVLVNGWRAAGRYEDIFSAAGVSQRLVRSGRRSASGGGASGLASGVYVCRLTAGTFVASKTMMLIK